ncbi:MAG: hypothetical protein ISS19_08015 [Bacteroidales bacterium]|nr:hypothetical protein [Bacteroidales bacterium]
MHNKEIQEFISENSSLLWYIPDREKINISLDLLVETILNYGDEKSVQKLFDLVGINEVADIFDKQISGRRVNYFPQVINFFNLYFQRHAQRNIDNRSK